MKLDEAQTLGVQLMRQHGLGGTGWSIGFDRAARRAGACHWSTQRITLSVHFVENNSAIEIHDTILHEIAHALAGYEAGHGPDWQHVARSIGCTATRCYDHTRVDMPVLRYQATCKCGVLHSRRNRPKYMNNPGSYWCTKCGDTLHWTDTRSAT